MEILFCADPLNARRVDEAFQVEHDAVLSAGIDISLLNFEALVYENDPSAAVARVPAAGVPTSALYRGWMLTVEQYQQLFEVLQERRIVLVNTPKQYAHCHWLPLSYAEIAA